jgi:glycosyltransferase involved in cell wall biosynthesis
VRLVQVGAYPPPYGGVTVHLMRLHRHLLDAGLHNTIIDLSGVPKDVPGVVSLPWSEATAYLERIPRSVVHFHNFAPGNAGVYGRLSSRHVTLLSLHNERFGDELAALDPLRRRIAAWRLRRIHQIVVDSEHCRDLASGIWGRRAAIRVIPEFIPPARVPSLTDPVALKLRARCRYLLAGNAWRIEVHRGQDLYGLDLLVELARRLVHDRGLDVGVVLLLPGGEASDMQPLLDRVRDAGLADRFAVITEPLEEASSLWRVADVVVRATNTDGNSLTVLEALAVGTPVVASDCVERPAGTALFRNRDQDDLTHRVAQVLSDLPGCRERVRAVSPASNAAAFIALYSGLRDIWERADARSA